MLKGRRSLVSEGIYWDGLSECDWSQGYRVQRGHVIKPLIVVKFTASLRDRIAFVL